jgi:hypothetical protein
MKTDIIKEIEFFGGTEEDLKLIEDAASDDEMVTESPVAVDKVTRRVN